MGHKIQSVRDANIKPHSHLTESVWGGLVLDICPGLIFGERGLIFSVPGFHLVEGIQKNNNVLISLSSEWLASLACFGNFDEAHPKE